VEWVQTNDAKAAIQRRFFIPGMGQPRWEPCKIPEIGRITYGSPFALRRISFTGKVPMKPSSVLLVAPTPQLATTLMGWLTEAGCEVVLVTSFAAGKSRLEDGPSLLISEIRLGDYNGLHLALRARSGGIPSIVVGGADSVLQREAERLTVAYLTYQLDRSQLASTIECMTPLVDDAARPARMAASNLSFVSWDELVPIVSERDETLSLRTRRTLGS